MRRAFYVVGPTASGKSDIAVEVAVRCDVEIVNADAFQVYRGMRRLTAQPDAAMLARVPHHLVGAVDPAEEMSAAKFVEMADRILDRHNALVVSGSGLYVRALSEGLSPMPAGDSRLRERLEQLSLGELNAWLKLLDPAAAEKVDQQNRRRVARALEICLLTGKPVSQQHDRTRSMPAGVFLFRDREDLYHRIDMRVEKMFADGVVEEVKALNTVGITAQQAIGLREIRQVIAGELSVPECIARVQQATRRYAKRQLTWFRRQTNFEPLNLSQRSNAEAVEWIAQKVRVSFAE